MNGLRASRRDVLAGAGLALAGSILPPVGAARESTLRTAGARSLIVLQDPHLLLPAEARRNLDRQGSRLIELEADPVRMWRGEQGRLLAAPATRLLGVTSWPNFLMVRGLAEESGRRVRYQRLDAASGAMVWLIA